MEAPERLALLRDLLAQTRVGALSTVTADGPYGSMTPFVHDPDRGAVHIHVSGLAKHTRHMQADARVSLLVTEADGPDKNPLALPRVTLCGKITEVPRDAPEYPSLKARYLERFPNAETMFSLPDFKLLSLTPDTIHLVAGFGKAYNLPVDALGAG